MITAEGHERCSTITVYQIAFLIRRRDLRSLAGIMIKGESVPSLHTYRLFISHAWRYSDGYQRFLAFLNQASNFVYSNYSVPEAQAFTGLSRAGLEEQLRKQIRPTQCVLIVSGMYVAHSDWIQFEIDFARSLGKPIVGIVPWGAERTPIAVQIAADEIVAWQTSSIVSAIRRNVP